MDALERCQTWVDKRLRESITNCELEQAADEQSANSAGFLQRVIATRKMHPLEKFAGILSDSEAQELKQAIVNECRQIDVNEW